MPDNENKNRVREKYFGNICLTVQMICVLCYPKYIISCRETVFKMKSILEKLKIYHLAFLYCNKYFYVENVASRTFALRIETEQYFCLISDNVIAILRLQRFFCHSIRSFIYFFSPHFVVLFLLIKKHGKGKMRQKLLCMCLLRILVFVYII